MLSLSRVVTLVGALAPAACHVSGAALRSRTPVTIAHRRRCDLITMAADIPGSPKELATEASLGVQSALSDGLLRLEVVAPDGLCFFGSMGKQMLGDPDFAVPAATKEKADRELAYLVCEMFQALGDGVACVLPSDAAVGVAQREWTKGRLATRLVSSASALGIGGKPGAKSGFGRAAGMPRSPLRVVVLVRTNKERLAELQPVIEPLGDECVVVLVNPTRLKSGGSRQGYTPAFILRDNPHPDWRGGLLYHRYPQQWLLGVAASRGRAVIHGRSTERPTAQTIDEGFAKIKDDKSLVSTAGGLLSATGTAAALERRESLADVASQ